MQVQELALGLMVVPEFHVAPFLKPAKVLLDNILPSSCTPRFDVMHKLAEGTLNPTICVIDEDMK